MYLSNPALEEEGLTAAWTVLRLRVEKRMTAAPGLYHSKRRAPRQPVRRKGSDNPLRLARFRRPAAKGPRAARKKAALPQPEELLREAILRAKRRGVSLADLAEGAGMSEKTLRRRLSVPDTMPLGEFKAILRLAGGGAP